MKNIFNIGEIESLINDLNKENQKIVLVGGCFDLLHLGHITFLEKAKELGDILIVILESDERIRKTKEGGRPVNNQLDRAKILASLKSVDYVILLPSMEKDRDYDELVLKIKPDFIATTKNDSSLAHKQRTAGLVGAKVQAVIELLENYSTGKLIQKIKES